MRDTARTFGIKVQPDGIGFGLRNDFAIARMGQTTDLDAKHPEEFLAVKETTENDRRTLIAYAPCGDYSATEATNQVRKSRNLRTFAS